MSRLNHRASIEVLQSTPMDIGQEGPSNYLSRRRQSAPPDYDDYNEPCGRNMLTSDGKWEKRKLHRTMKNFDNCSVNRIESLKIGDAIVDYQLPHIERTSYKGKDLDMVSASRKEQNCINIDAIEQDAIKSEFHEISTVDCANDSANKQEYMKYLSSEFLRSNRAAGKIRRKAAVQNDRIFSKDFVIKNKDDFSIRNGLQKRKTTGVGLSKLENSINKSSFEKQNKEKQVESEFKIHYVAPKLNRKNHLLTGERNIKITTENKAKNVKSKKNNEYDKSTSKKLTFDKAKLSESANEKLAEKLEVERTENKKVIEANEKERKRQRRRWSNSLMQLMKKDNKVLNELKKRLLQKQISITEPNSSYVEVDMNKTDTLNGIENELKNFSCNVEGVKNELDWLKHGVENLSACCSSFEDDKLKFIELSKTVTECSGLHELDVDEDAKMQRCNEDAKRNRFQTM